MPLVRTPLYHGLIAEFGIRHQRLPETQAELFEDYVRHKLASALDASEITSEKIDELLTLAEDTADLLFASDRFGLEAPCEALKAQLSEHDVDAFVATMRRALLARVGKPPRLMFSFSHRRIHEFFVIRHLLRAGKEIELDWAAEDTRWRDAAVLYVELANASVAQKIAAACWEEIEAIRRENCSYADKRFFRALHCQRFLIEAFRARTDLLSDFRSALESHIEYSVAHSMDILSAKLAVEAVGLLSEGAVQRVVLKALERDDLWITETCVNACCYLPALPIAVLGEIWRGVVKVPESNFRRDIDRLRFIFGLSSGLARIRSLIEQRSADIASWRRWRWLPAGLLGLPVILIFAPFYYFGNLYRSKQRELVHHPYLSKRRGFIRHPSIREAELRHTVLTLSPSATSPK